MIYPRARFYWPSPQPQDQESLDARSIYELYADKLIRQATGYLRSREDIAFGDRVEILTDQLEYDRKVDYLVFELTALGLHWEYILEYRETVYAEGDQL